MLSPVKCGTHFGCFVSQWLTQEDHWIISNIFKIQRNSPVAEEDTVLTSRAMHVVCIQGACRSRERLMFVFLQKDTRQCCEATRFDCTHFVSLDQWIIWLLSNFSKLKRTLQWRREEGSVLVITCTACRLQIGNLNLVRFWGLSPRNTSVKQYCNATELDCTVWLYSTTPCNG